MVQVFGNRIIGGVGAPDPRMSEAFGAGVNTALSQRESRQAMVGEAQRQRMLEQEFSWKGEDRAEAKRRRAAAAAEAAAARAANKAALAGIGTAQPFFRIGAPTTGAGAVAPGAPSAPQGGVRIPLSMGTKASAAPAAANANISGGAGSTSVSGGAGTDRLGVTTPPTFYTPGTGDLSARPGNFASRATQGRVAEGRLAQQPQPVVVQTAMGPQVRMEPAAQQYTSDDLPLLLQQKQLLQRRRADEVAARQEGGFRFGRSEDLDALIAEEQALDAAIAEAQQRPGAVSARGVAALEGPEAVGAGQEPAGPYYPEGYVPPQMITIQGPNGPIRVPVEDMGGDAMRFPPAGVRPPEPEPYQPPGDYTLGFGADVGAMQPTGQTMTFGERLGAAPTPTEMFFADIGRTPAGNVDLPALVAQQNSPVFDPNFSAIAEQERALYAYAAEDAMNKGDLNGYMTAVSKVRELETMILTQQLTLGVNEAVNYTSAQRLSAVASMVYGGADVVIIPKSGGLGDVYMNGRLQQKDADLNAYGDMMLQTIDAGYRAQVAAAEAERAGKVFETDEAIRQQTTIDANKAAVEDELKTRDLARAIEQDLGTKLNDVQVEQLKATLVASGKLPGPAADYNYQKLGEDTIVVLSNGQQVAAFQLQVQDTAAGPQTVLVDIGG